FKIAMICSSLNLLRFILVRLLCVGLYSKSVTFQGRTSGTMIASKFMGVRHDTGLARTRWWMVIGFHWPS
ncbi:MULTISPECIES: hypothetical protein, partial [unclassified Sphingomonas]